MKKKDIYILLACIGCFIIGVLCGMNFVLIKDEKVETKKYRDYIRIYDGKIEIFDEDKWNEVADVDELANEDQMVISKEDKLRLMEELNEELSSEMEKLSKEANEPIVKRKEIKRPVSTSINPSNNNESNSTSVDNGSSNGSAGNGSSGGSEIVTPPVEPPVPDSGDGEDIEWSGDHL